MSDILDLLDSMIIDKSKLESDYYFDGAKVPRVTKIISRCIHNDGLMYWANSIGFKHQSYSKTLNEAAKIGTQCHNNIDSYLDDQSHKAPEDIMWSARNAYNSFLKWFNDINSYAQVKVLMHEQPLICKYFGGTLDGLYDINGKIYIIDYKTSNHVTYNYCLQVAAYIYMLRETKNINVDGVIILQLSKKDVGYNEYSLNFDNPIDYQYIRDCEQAFLAMVYWYYNLCNVENGFNKIGWN